MGTPFPRLFSPIRLGHHDPQLDRLDAPQHHYGANGLPTDRLIAYPARYA